MTIRLLVLLLIVTGCSATPAPAVGGPAGDRHGRIEVPGRPQEPRPPFPYRSEDVVYRNGEVDLAGTLTLPEGPGPFTALLLITGSGRQDRDETVAGHKPFLVLADALTRAGYAVLRVDDRGVGGSSGDLAGADYDELVGDIVVGVEYLRSRPDVERVGLFGHSEGGYLAPLAVQRTADIAFVVSMAGAAVPGDQVLELQERLVLDASGLPPDQIEAQVAAVRKLIGLLRAEDYIGARAPARHVLAGEGVPPDQIDAKVPHLASRHIRALVLHDPAPSLDALAVPVLALYGGKDLQVQPTRASRRCGRGWPTTRTSPSRSSPS
ncbi:MAG: alpha/beta hydrolase [Pseudonocardiaceae bacterium]